MIKISITGSVSSGKTTASKFVSKKRGPLFSADEVVKKLYSKPNFKNKLIRKFNLNSKLSLKLQIKNKIFQNKKTLKKLETFIHPIVRKEMFSFINKNKKKKLLFFEIPLLIESNLNKHFDIIIFVKASKTLRRKRFKRKTGNDLSLFKTLDKHQLKDTVKMKYCDHLVVNNKSIAILRKKLLSIIRLYE